MNMASPIRALTGLGIIALLVAALTLTACATPPPAPTPVAAAPTAAPVEAAPPDLASMIGSKDLGSINKFFSNRAAVDKADSNGNFPLHNAVEQDAPAIITLLLSMQAKTDSLDRQQRSPLRLAVEEGKVECATLLAQKDNNLFSKDASNTTLVEAALSKGDAIIQAVFTAANVNSKGAEGSTALMIAADKLSETGVKTLLAVGADALARDASGRNALDFALLHPDRTEAARIAETLILKGANPQLSDFSWFAQTVRAVDYSSIRFEEGKTPLHMSVERRQLGLTDFLLTRGANPNARNSSGSAPLHEAVRAGWIDGATLLLAHKADPNARDSVDNTPLHISPDSDRKRMIELLLAKGADPSLKDKNGNTVLHLGIQLGYEEALIGELITAAPAIVNTANAEGDLPLIIAARSMRHGYIPLLLAEEADIFAANLRSESALSIAITRASTESLTAAASTGGGVDRTDTLNALLTPQNVNIRDNLGNTPLSIAIALKASQPAISLIVAKGGEVNARNNVGDTALHMAIRLGQRPQGEALLVAKSDVFVQNSKGETPISLGLSAAGGPLEWLFNTSVIASRDKNGDTILHHAARRNLAATMGFLGEKGVELDARNSDGKTALAVAVEADAADSTKALLAMGVSITARDTMGDTALHAAVLWSSRKSLILLLDGGADIAARNFSGEAAMHHAVRKKDADGIAVLLSRKVPLETRDNHGDSPLAIAARSGRPDLAIKLITAGADPESRNLDGKTPLLLAVETGDPESAKALVAVGSDILANDATGRNPVQAAALQGLAFLDIILTPATVNRKDSDGFSPLRILVEKGAGAEAVERAIIRGAVIDIRDVGSTTALHAAIKAGNLPIITLLATAGADLFVRASDGETPASLALSRGQATLVALLSNPVATAITSTVSPAARLKSVDPLGNTLLIYAALAGNDEGVDKLLSLGADKTMRNIFGETAADIARRKGFTALATKLK
ncbi:MAG: ankyrin repeat domain-containing protein [Rectinemataceae bacterium]